IKAVPVTRLSNCQLMPASLFVFITLSARSCLAPCVPQVNTTLKRLRGTISASSRKSRPCDKKEMRLNNSAISFCTVTLVKGRPCISFRQQLLHRKLQPQLLQQLYRLQTVLALSNGVELSQI